MNNTKKKSTPLGCELAKFNLPITTMQALRAEAAREGCSITYIASRLLNAYARGEIKQEFSRVA